MNENAVPVTRKLPAWHIHKRLYDWVLHFAHTKHGLTALFCISFAESSFFPVPPDVLLAPLSLGAPKKWLKFATVCSIASLFGGILGYIIGTFLWAGVGNFFHNYVPGFSRDKIVLTDNTNLEGFINHNSLKIMPGLKVIPTYPLSFTTKDKTERVLNESEIKEVKLNVFNKVGVLYSTYDWEIVAFAGFTPFPYKVITITSGIYKINFIIFIIASALSRAARFFMVAGLFRWKGEAIRPFIDKYFNWLTLLFVLLLVGGFAAIKLFK